MSFIQIPNYVVTQHIKNYIDHLYDHVAYIQEKEILNDLAFLILLNRFTFGWFDCFEPTRENAIWRLENSSHLNPYWTVCYQKDNLVCDLEDLIFLCEYTREHDIIYLSEEYAHLLSY